MNNAFNKSIFSTFALLASIFLAAACDDGHDHGPDEAHLIFVNSPPTAITVNTPVEVAYQVHTEGDLHHTEIRACTGHSTDCGLGDASSFDVSFPATAGDDQYTATVTIDSAGPWTIAVFAHVGETPHISDVVHATVSE